MRKESIGRLLLSLVTAFVMVAGVFGAAVQTWSIESPTGEELNQPISEIAASELDMKTGGTGEAPVSAIPQLSISSASESESEIPAGFEMNTGDLDVDFTNDGEQVSGMSSEVPLDHGTRQVSVDANGPYGERPPDGIPYYEGDTVLFEADIIGGSVDDYVFRWDVDDDEVWDGPGAAPDYWGGKGESAYTKDTTDNHIGEAKVEAWDEISMKTIIGDGDVWDENSNPTYYHYAGYYGVVGMRFRTTMTVTIDELGMFRYSYPYQYYNVRLWDATTQALLREVTNPYVPNRQWRWFSITPITIPAGAYVVSVGFRGYYQRGSSNPGPTSDGVIIPESWVRYYNAGYPSTRYPSQVMSNTRIPFIDFKYSYTYQLPDVLEDTADVFVDNRAPVAINPQVIGEPGQEGSDIGYTGSLIDAGADDDWWFRWDFGDGDVSPWQIVPKYPVYEILFLEALAGMAGTTITALQQGLPPHAQMTVFDIEGGNPTLEFMLEFDVILVATWGYPDDWDELGDLLADASDAGVGVVQCGGSFWPSPPGDMGIMGRWYAEEYNAIDYTIPTVSTRYLGSFDASHPIMDGVTELTSLVNHPSTSTTTYSYWVADYSDGGILLAATDDDHHGITGSGRIVAYNTYINQGSPMYATGDHIKIIANACGWAAHAAGPYDMPIPLPTIYHKYKDDHPDSITPEDTFDVQLEIKDDDHGRIFGGAGADWGNNIAQAPAATATHSGGGVGVWGPHRLNNGDKAGVYNDCWTRGNGGTNNYVQLEWPTPQFIGGMTAYYTRYRIIYGYTLHACDVQYWDGSSWVTDQHYDDGQHSKRDIDAVIELTAPVTTTKVRLTDMKTFGANSNIMIQEWEVYPGLPGGDPYEMYGLGEAFTTVLIQNVWPTAINSENVVLDVAENTPILFEEFKIVDPALNVKTEAFRYRWDFDDGTPRGPWLNPMGAGVKDEFRVLLFHSLAATGTGTPLATQVVDTLTAIPEVISVDTFNFYEGGSYPTVPTLDEMKDKYDVIMFGSSYNLPGDTSREQFGDNLADWMDETGGGVVTMMYTYGQAGAGNEQWTLLGRYIDDDYGPYEKAPRLFGTRSLGNILVPSHPVMQGITDLGTGNRHDGMLDLTPGGIKLAEWTGGYPAIGVKENPSGARAVHLSGGGYTLIQGDFDVFLRNAVNWVGSGAKIEIAPVEHNFMDNGVYDVHLEIIDDDMKWDFSSGYPVFTGTGLPGDTEEDWIGGTVFTTSIDNVDPVISPRIRAYAELDLSLRMSGNKHNTATMRLEEYKDGVLVQTQETTVYRDPGSPDIGVLSAVIQMTKDYDYNLEIEYDPNDLAGSNPTWIFEAHWPDGKIKQLKHTFNSNDPSDRVWNIGSVKPMMLGHDIIFEAEASDDGSDDLAFIWSWGDTTPQGVHIFANKDPDVFVGVTDEATIIFNQDPDREPWFDRVPNTIRSPDGTAISIKDSISHVFDENQPAFIYVTLTVLDDDVEDGYPSPYNNGGGYDMEFVEIDFT